jgi:hypothetical protein
MLTPFFSRDIFDDSFFNTRKRSPSSSDLMSYAEFNPTVDVKETKDAITLHCELAGVPMENVSLDYKDERLTISGKKDERKEDKDKGTIAMMRLCSRSLRFETFLLFLVRYLCLSVSLLSFRLCFFSFLFVPFVFLFVVPSLFLLMAQTRSGIASSHATGNSAAPFACHEASRVRTLVPPRRTECWR